MENLQVLSRFALAKRWVGTTVACHRRLATATVMVATFGATLAATATTGAAGGSDQQLTALQHFNSLGRHDDEPQYWSHATQDGAGSASANSGPYYFSVNYGQQVDWSDWWQSGACPCFGYIEWNRTYAYAIVQNAKRGGECGCAPFDMNQPTVATFEWEWYHHRHNNSRQVTQNSDTQTWTGGAWCCAGSDDEAYHGTYREQDDYYDPLVKAFFANAGYDSYPQVMVETPDYYADWGY